MWKRWLASVIIPGVQYEHITDSRQLADFCASVAAAPWIAFDTEFVSEDSYRPELCLVQVAVGDRLAVIDPLAIPDMTPFWERIVAPGHETIVHAGREEFRFCRWATGARPHQLFDVQLAAGLVGLEYPAAYGNLISKLLGKTLAKGETRTDWRRRPLSDAQLEYALLDVVYLERVRAILGERIEKLGRRSWMVSETEAWQKNIEEYEEGERWRRLSGVAGLSSRVLAIVRELWHWREALALQRNWPVRRVLRDDLIIELARRQSADPRRIRAIRGLERGDLQKHLPQLSACIERALQLSVAECPQPAARSGRPQLNLIGQFLHTAVSSLCHRAQVAPSLVGTVEDVRDLIAFRLKLGDAGRAADPPSLATGWRATVVGHAIDDLLHGKMAIQISDPLSDVPLSFVNPSATRPAATHAPSGTDSSAEL